MLDQPAALSCAWMYRCGDARCASVRESVPARMRTASKCRFLVRRESMAIELADIVADYRSGDTAMIGYLALAKQRNHQILVAPAI